jgi:perosamine synthetase
VGVAQAERLDEFLPRKRAVGRLYRELLAGVPGLELAPERTGYAENLWWVFGLVLDESVPFDAAEAMRRLAALGVGSRPFFYPLHRQPFFDGAYHGLSLPVAERLGERGLYLPSGLALTDDQVRRSAAALRAVLGAP